MAKVSVLTHSNGDTEFTLDFYVNDYVPFHWDLTFRMKMLVIWRILWGRAFNMSGPMTFRMRTSQPPEVIR
jgi:hypothetical protein